MLLKTYLKDKFEKKPKNNRQLFDDKKLDNVKVRKLYNDFIITE